jgi:hypothetical protein
LVLEDPSGYFLGMAQSGANNISVSSELSARNGGWTARISYRIVPRLYTSAAVVEAVLTPEA